MSKDQALALAEQQNTDLVVISPNGDPPVAKLLNANKYFYEQKRKEKETAKKFSKNAYGAYLETLISQPST